MLDQYHLNFSIAFINISIIIPYGFKPYSPLLDKKLVLILVNVNNVISIEKKAR